MSDASIPTERYVLGEMVGRGGMGVVYRATDTALEREVAIKILDENNRPAVDIADRLQREAGILAQLEHPGIVPVHDIGVFGHGRAFYVMRLVRGKRLDEHVSGGVTRGEVLRIMLRLCETGAFAHARGIIHRDLKPGNIMIGPFGEVLVLDWGVAKVLASEDRKESKAVDIHLSGPTGASMTEDGAIVGTPGYMSPEQQSGGSARVNETADVFALGVMLAELLEQESALREGAAMPRALQAIVARARAAQPTDRYRSVMELADDIRRWMDGQSVTAYRERSYERVFRLYKQHQTAVLLVATYLVVRTVILLWRDI
ncbi:MAG: serine/threonine protein kinase [Phycisphaerae bacterium]|nr:serine/threonine protein kinase [Gemmatimonadaceae bacterium]